jgi:serine/threonine protein phosphatase PrpC
MGKNDFDRARHRPFGGSASTDAEEEHAREALTPSPQSEPSQSSGRDALPGNSPRAFLEKRTLPSSPVEASATPSLVFHPVGFHFNVPKVEGKGEDADPIAIWEHNQGVLAVFDGLGGAGSTNYHHKGVAHTGAYIASRVAMNEVKSFASAFQPRPAIPLDVANLRNDLSYALRHKAANLEAESEPSRLKSKLIKRLPTTIAAFFVAQQSETTIDCQIVWAGDSRCYALSPSTGLQQLSTDDIKSGGDALNNLKTDSPLSNYLNADTDFELNSRVWQFTQPLILLAATDGCFGYLLSPAHFEFLLLDTLAKAKDDAQWREEVIRRLSGSAGDDCSMSLLPLGWSSFNALKETFRERLLQLRQEYIEPLDALTKEIDESSKLLREAESRKNDGEARREVLRQELWRRYKATHDQYLQSEDDKLPTVISSHAEPAQERKPVWSDKSKLPSFSERTMGTETDEKELSP